MPDFNTINDYINSQPEGTKEALFTLKIVYSRLPLMQKNYSIIESLHLL